MDDGYTTYVMFGTIFSYCPPKAFSWQGKHIKIQTIEQPKEDFIVEDYVVVGYAPCEYQKDAKRLYKFALFQNGEQVHVITLDQHDYMTTMYFLEAETGNSGGSNNMGMHVTYKHYGFRPTYKQVKQDVITVLLGGKS